jgi:RimJ/RimL family protein N-acetyltransferase
MHVLPSSQRLGVGRKLLDCALARLEFRKVRLCCAAANPAGRAFSERCGFVADGTDGTYEVGGSTVPTVRYVLIR